MQLRRKHFLFFVLFMSYFSCLCEAIKEKPIVVIITSYNNSQWYKKNLDSVFMQQYTNYRVIYVDDASTDGIGELVAAYINDHNLHKKMALIRNATNKRKLANLYHAIHNLCHDNEIVVELDGDDWLAHKQVLSIINSLYSKKNIWLAYASYRDVGKSTFRRRRIMVCRTPERVIRQRSYRNHLWIWSGLRTYYTWLFKRIKKKDLVYPSGQYVGEFFKTSSDGATMFPMLEMAGQRIDFIAQPLLLRNVATPLNDFKVNRKSQQRISVILRKQAPYPVLRNKG